MIIRNIDDAQPSIKNGSYGGNACFKDGVIIDGENYLIKYPKSTNGLKRCEEMLYTNDTVSEYIGSHIYQILGIPVHETMLVERNGKIAVACKDFTKDGSILLEIRTLKNTANQRLAEKLEKDFNTTGSLHTVDFDELMLHLKYNDILSKVEGITARFWDMAVVDIFINNNDRNNGNWGILRDKNGIDTLAPVFDNGGAFNGKTPDSRLERMLNDSKSIEGSVLNNIVAFGRDDKNFLAKDFINFDIPELKQSLIRNIPTIQKHKDEIEQMIQNIPDSVCSKVRKDFYLKSLDIKMEKMLIPAYNKIDQMQTLSLKDELKPKSGKGLNNPKRD